MQWKKGEKVIVEKGAWATSVFKDGRPWIRLTGPVTGRARYSFQVWRARQGDPRDLLGAELSIEIDGTSETVRVWSVKEIHKYSKLEERMREALSGEEI